jgi:hypothetical protein
MARSDGRGSGSASMGILRAAGAAVFCVAGSATEAMERERVWTVSRGAPAVIWLAAPQLGAMSVIAMGHGAAGAAQRRPASVGCAATRPTSKTATEWKNRFIRCLRV